MTEVVHHVEDGEGTGQQGILVQVEPYPRPAYGPDSSVLARINRRTDDQGDASFDLLPNVDLDPSDTVYRVTEWPTARRSQKFYINVPTGGGPYSMEELIVEPPDEADSVILNRHRTLKDTEGHLPVPFLSGPGVETVTDEDFDDPAENGDVVFVEDTTTDRLYEVHRTASRGREFMHTSSPQSQIITEQNAKWRFTGVTAYAGQVIDMVLPNDAVATWTANDTAPNIQSAIDTAAGVDGIIVVTAGGGGKQPLYREFEYQGNWGNMAIPEPVLRENVDQDLIEGFMDDTQTGQANEDPITFTATLPDIGEVEVDLDLANAATTVADCQALIDDAVGTPGLVIFSASTLTQTLTWRYRGDLREMDLADSFTSDRHDNLLVRAGSLGGWESVRYGGPLKRPLVAAFRFENFTVNNGNNPVDFREGEALRGEEWCAFDAQADRFTLRCPEGEEGAYSVWVNVELWPGLDTREVLISKGNEDGESRSFIEGIIGNPSGIGNKLPGALEDNAMSASVPYMDLVATDYIAVDLFWWGSTTEVGSIDVFLMKLPNVV